MSNKKNEINCLRCGNPKKFGPFYRSASYCVDCREQMLSIVRNSREVERNERKKMLYV